jgi:hypothetical protein
VKRRVTGILVFASILCVATPAWADQTAADAKRQPIGIYTNDDGEQIVVGVGTTKPLTTLDVSRGEVKLGSTGATCTAVLAGAIRYAQAKLQFCDGEGWRNVSLDKAQ